MELPCVGKGISFEELSEALEAFFSENGFHVWKKEIQQGYNLIARPVKHTETRPPILITVKGDPDEFTINFTGLEQTSPKASEYFLGVALGHWQSKKIFDKTDDTFNFEQQFWAYIMQVIEKLEGSAKESNHLSDT
jgi:hypothetical protein